MEVMDVLHFIFVKLILKQVRQYTYNVTMRSICSTHYCRVQEISITYSECMSVPLFTSTQSERAVLHCHLWPVQLKHIFFFQFISKATRFCIKVMDNVLKMRVFVFSTNVV